MLVHLLGYPRSNPPLRLPKPRRTIEARDFERIAKYDETESERKELSKALEKQIKDRRKLIQERAAGRDLDLGITASQLQNDPKIFAYNLVGEINMILANDGIWQVPKIKDGKVEYVFEGRVGSLGKTALERVREERKVQEGGTSEPIIKKQLRVTTGKIIEFDQKQQESLRIIRDLLLTYLDKKVPLKQFQDRYFEALSELKNYQIKEINKLYTTALAASNTKTPGQRQALQQQLMLTPGMKSAPQRREELLRGYRDYKKKLYRQRHKRKVASIERSRKSLLKSAEERFERAGRGSLVRDKALYNDIRKQLRETPIYALDLSKNEEEALDDYEETLNFLIYEGRGTSKEYKTIDKKFTNFKSAVKLTRLILEYEKQFAKKYGGTANPYLTFSEFELKERGKSREEDKDFEVLEIEARRILGRLESLKDEISFLEKDVDELRDFPERKEERVQKLQRLKKLSENKYRYELSMRPISGQGRITLLRGIAANKDSASKSINIAARILSSVLQGSNYYILDKKDRQWLSANAEKISYIESNIATMLDEKPEETKVEMPSEINFILQKAKVKGKMTKMEGIKRAKDCQNMRSGEERFVEKDKYSYYVKKTSKGYTYQIFVGDNETAKRRLQDHDCTELEKRICRLAGGVVGAKAVVAARENPSKVVKLYKNAHRGVARSMRKKNPIGRQSAMKLPKEAARPEDIADLTQLFSIPSDNDDAFRVGYYFGVIRGIDTCGLKNLLNRRKIRDQFSKKVMESVMKIPDTASAKATVAGRRGGAKDDDYSFTF